MPRDKDLERDDMWREIFVRSVAVGVANNEFGSKEELIMYCTTLAHLAVRKAIEEGKLQ